MRILHIYEIFIILAETLNYKLTRTKNILAALCGVFVLAGVAFATYTVATKSQKEISDLIKQNIEALVQSTREGGEFQKECYDTYSDYSNLGTLVNVLFAKMSVS